MAEPKSDTAIREVAPGVWTFSRPFSFYNRLPVGGRSTAIKLNDGSVWLLASTSLTDEIKAKLQELGEVKYIIAPSVFYHLFLRSFKDQYPNAKVIGPKGLNAKKEAEGRQLDEVFDANQPDFKHGFEDEMTALASSLASRIKMLPFTIASKTVIGADLQFNLPGTEQYALSDASPYFPVLTYLRPGFWLMRLLIWKKEKNFETTKRDATKVASWDFKKYIPCHGNVIESNAKIAWKATYQRYGI